VVDSQGIARAVVATVIGVAAFFLFVVFPTRTPQVALVRLLGVNATELADRLGLSYERLAAGEYRDALADRIDTDEVTVTEFQPRRRLPERLRTGAQGVAYSLGAGLAGVVADETAFDVELR